MAQPANPPDGWSIVDGTWGVDFLRDTSIALTSGSSLAVVGPAAQAQTMYGPWLPIDANGVAYVATSVIRSTNMTSLLTLKLEIYAADQSTLTTTIYLYNNQAVTAANTWLTPSYEFSTTTNYAWGRFVLTRASGSTATLNLDRVELKKLGPRWAIRKTGAAQNLLATTFVNFETADYANLVTASAASVRIYRAGTYLMRFQARVASLGASDNVTAFFRINHPTEGTSDFGECIFGVFTVGATLQSFVNVVGTYRHSGTAGVGTVISCGLYYSGAGAPTIATGGGEHNALTTFTGTWLGLG